MHLRYSRSGISSPPCGKTNQLNAIHSSRHREGAAFVEEPEASVANSKKFVTSGENVQSTSGVINLHSEKTCFDIPEPEDTQKNVHNESLDVKTESDNLSKSHSNKGEINFKLLSFFRNCKMRLIKVFYWKGT